MGEGPKMASGVRRLLGIEMTDTCQYSITMRFADDGVLELSRMSPAVRMRV